MMDVPLPNLIVDRSAREWVNDAVLRLEQEAARSADTHLIQVELPSFPGIRFYFKDESAHPTGSLKHRLARSLFLYALCNGRLRRGQKVVDVSSGSTAISEAWFARLLGVPFVAIVPSCTGPAKLREIRMLGGECDLVEEHGQEQVRAAWHVGQGACYLDQFGLAERATDWRGNNNIAESILTQLAREPDPEPAWIVCGAGTGGTSATIGRYLRYRRLNTRLCIAEPRGSAFAEGWPHRDRSASAKSATLIEGIGRPRVEPGFLFEVIDNVIEVDDAASCAGSLLLEKLLGHRYGGSSGTNFVACLELAGQMRQRGERGSIVTLLCDRGERYAETLFNPDWRSARGLGVEPWLGALESCLASGRPKGIS
jgi:cysteine synthase